MAACHSTDGEALLRELGDAIRATSAILIMCGVGVGLREHILATTALPVDRLLEGTLGNASHQVSANLPVHPPVNAAKLSQASIAYRHFSGQTGFLLVPAPREAARGFAAIYDRCGVSRCTMTSAAMFRLYTNAFFCYTVASDIAGWPDAAGFAVQRDLVALCIKAMREIAGLKRFGWTGKLARLILSPGLFLRMIRKIEREIRPLDFAAFNRFHHGGKVLAQDIAVLRCCLAEGVSQRRPMAALTELLRQFDATQENRTRMRA